MPELAHELGTVLKPRKNFILLNLIPYNPTDVGDNYDPPSDDDIRKFHEILISDKYRIHTRVRKEMGQDIDGACGQLVVEHQKRGKSNLDKGKRKGASPPEIEDLSIAGRHKRESSKASGSKRGKKQTAATNGMGGGVFGIDKKPVIVAGCAIVAALSVMFVASRVRRR